MSIYMVNKIKIPKNKECAVVHAYCHTRCLAVYVCVLYARAQRGFSFFPKLPQIQLPVLPSLLCVR